MNAEFRYLDDEGNFTNIDDCGKWHPLGFLQTGIRPKYRIKHVGAGSDRANAVSEIEHYVHLYLERCKPIPDNIKGLAVRYGIIEGE